MFISKKKNAHLPHVYRTCPHVRSSGGFTARAVVPCGITGRKICFTDHGEEESEFDTVIFTLCPRDMPYDEERRLARFSISQNRHEAHWLEKVISSIMCEVCAQKIVFFNFIQGTEALPTFPYLMMRFKNRTIQGVSLFEQYGRRNRW